MSLDLSCFWRKAGNGGYAGMAELADAPDLGSFVISV